MVVVLDREQVMALRRWKDLLGRLEKKAAGTRLYYQLDGAQHSLSDCMAAAQSGNSAVAPDLGFPWCMSEKPRERHSVRGCSRCRKRRVGPAVEAEEEVREDCPSCPETSLRSVAQPNSVSDAVEGHHIH